MSAARLASALLRDRRKKMQLAARKLLANMRLAIGRVDKKAALRAERSFFLAPFRSMPTASAERLCPSEDNQRHLSSRPFLCYSVDPSPDIGVCRHAPRKKNDPHSGRTIRRQTRRRVCHQAVQGLRCRQVMAYIVMAYGFLHSGPLIAFSELVVLNSR